MANVGVQRALKLLVFTETQLSARFLHFVIIFCQKMAVFPYNAREAQLSACHLKRNMCHWGRRILARFLFTHVIYGALCAPLRIPCDSVRYGTQKINVNTSCIYIYFFTLSLRHFILNYLI